MGRRNQFDICVLHRICKCLMLWGYPFLDKAAAAEEALKDSKKAATDANKATPYAGQDSEIVGGGRLLQPYALLPGSCLK